MARLEGNFPVHSVQRLCARDQIECEESWSVDRLVCCIRELEDQAPTSLTHLERSDFVETFFEVKVRHRVLFAIWRHQQFLNLRIFRSIKKTVVNYLGSRINNQKFVSSPILSEYV